MKRLILALMMAAVLLLGIAAAESHLSANGIATADDGVMHPELTALELTRLMGNGINLGNTFEACDNSVGSAYSDDPTRYEQLWGQPVTTQEMLLGMKAAGFDSIRIPVAWMTNATHLSEGDWTISETYLNRVEEVINYALNAGMYVIVNDHWDGGWYGMFGSESAETRAQAMEAYKGMWTQIAQRYAEYGDRLIFEGANEEIGARFDEDSPLYAHDSVKTYLSDNERYALANEVNQAFVDTVRATGGNNATRFLLIPGYGTNIGQTCDDRFVMPKDTADNRLLISVHYYDPWSYCGSANAAGATRWGTKKDFEDMNAELARMTKFTDMGVGVVIGEYGALPGGDGIMKDNCVAYHRNFLDNCDLHNFASCLWDCSGFFIRRTLTMADEGLAELYTSRSLANETEEAPSAAEAALAAAIESAPATFLENAIELTDDTCVAWLMWNSADWQLSYSVGDTYTPDSVSNGIKVTDAVIDGEGTYTVGLDFTGTEAGYSNSTAFSAIGIMNGELLHPNWCLHFTEITVNGQTYKVKARPYTTSDDGKCTRVNLFNEWVTSIPSSARVLYGPVMGVSATLIDRNDEVFSHIESIYITFEYAERK